MRKSILVAIVIGVALILLASLGISYGVESSPSSNYRAQSTSIGTNCRTYESRHLAFGPGESRISSIVLPPLVGRVTYYVATMNLKSDYAGGLTAYLKTPTNCSSQLFSQDLNCGEIDNQLVFRNTGWKHVESNDYPENYLLFPENWSYMPNENFVEKFRQGGKWQLTLTDDSASATSEFDWSILVCLDTVTPVPVNPQTPWPEPISNTLYIWELNAMQTADAWTCEDAIIKAVPTVAQGSQTEWLDEQVDYAVSTVDLFLCNRGSAPITCTVTLAANATGAFIADEGEGQAAVAEYAGSTLGFVSPGHGPAYFARDNGTRGVACFGDDLEPFVESANVASTLTITLMPNRYTCAGESNFYEVYAYARGNLSACDALSVPVAHSELSISCEAGTWTPPVPICGTPQPGGWWSIW